jgi:hypothetical protein
MSIDKSPKSTAPEELTPLQETLSMRYRFGSGCLSDAETGACCCHSIYAELWAEFVAPVLLREAERRGDLAAWAELTTWLRDRPAPGTATHASEARRRYAR